MLNEKKPPYLCSVIIILFAWPFSVHSSDSDLPTRCCGVCVLECHAIISPNSPEIMYPSGLPPCCWQPWQWGTRRERVVPRGTRMERRKPAGRWAPLLRAPSAAQANPIWATGPTREVLLVPLVLLLAFMMLVPLQRAGGRKPGLVLGSWSQLLMPSSFWRPGAEAGTGHTGELPHFCWHSAMPFPAPRVLLAGWLPEFPVLNSITAPSDQCPHRLRSSFRRKKPVLSWAVI